MASPRSMYRARAFGLSVLLAIAVAAAAFAPTGCATTAPTGFQSPVAGDPGVDTITLVEGGYGQYLVPVKIGNQTLNLLLDSGARSLLVFSDLLNEDNTAVQRTEESVSLLFGSGLRSGVVGTAPVQVGRHSADSMRIMLIDFPQSNGDPSLVAKEADGIIGFRFQPGLVEESGGSLDVPLLSLEPVVHVVQFDFGAEGGAELTLGSQPTIDDAASDYVFAASTTTELGADRVQENYADLEVPFSVTTRLGTAAEADLDILLDTGAVSELVLGKHVATQLGYDEDTRTWALDADDEIQLSIVGMNGLLPLKPSFTVSEIRVAGLSTTTFDAVLGLDRWQEYVIGFSFIDFTLGGPDGQFQFLKRSDLLAALQGCDAPGAAMVPLPGLNSSADDIATSIAGNGQRIAFASDRAGGTGDEDIYIYDRPTQSLQDVDAINSTGTDNNGILSADGTSICFVSNRTGNDDIYLYDLAAGAFIDLPGLNTAGIERSAGFSPDGRYIGFRSEREESDSPSDIYVYDRETAQLLDLPGLNTTADEYSPSLSEDARFIVLDAFERPGGAGRDDVWLYDRVAQEVVGLPAIVNSGGMDAFATVDASANRIAYITTANQRGASVSGADILIFDRTLAGPGGLVGGFLDLPGLNSNTEEAAPSLSGNGSLVCFNSRRCGGNGGLDVYLYDISFALARR